MLTLWRRILYWCGLVDLVWLEWVPRRYYLRIVWRDSEGRHWVKIGNGRMRMAPDGKFDDHDRVGHDGTERWHPYDHHPLKEAARKRRMTWRRPSKAARVAARLTGEEQIV
jgi:hypothetical protein